LKPLVLLIITIVFASNVYAEPEELDREKYVYYCWDDDIDVDKHGNTGCEGIKKGDVLRGVAGKDALLYCEKGHLILNEPLFSYTCFYNGHPIKKWKSLK